MSQLQDPDAAYGAGERASPTPAKPSSSPSGEAAPARQRIGLLLGPAAMLLLILLPAPEGMSQQAWRTTAVGVLMAVWWVSEAIPVAATALVPLVLFPMLGILPIRATAVPYANPTIFLYLGGFVLALAMERWGLHRRVALGVVRVIGVRPNTVVLGMMLATAFVSAWVSNTATAVMMLPIGLSIIQLVRPDTEYGPGQPVDFNFALGLLLGIAYAASIGGLATLIGTPPNALLAGFMSETYGVRIGFVQWMLVGVPLVVVSLPLTWLVLTRFVFPIQIREIPGGRETIEREYRALGPVSRAERWVAGVFAATALLWIFRPLLQEFVPGLDDAGIAVAAALALFVIPLDRRQTVYLMDWKTAEKLPWGVLLLFGGGLALADAVQQSGLAEWIAGRVGGVDLPVLGMVLLVTAVIIFLTELTSNTATAAAFLPLLAAIAIGLGENPFLLVIPAAIAASCAFMMPVATPPNAIVYGSGLVTVPQMARAGLWLNLLFIVLITVLMYSLVLAVFGVEPGVLPDWAATK